MAAGSETVMMKAGLYYIGDLCYVMHPEWNEFCNITISGQRCLQGKFTLADGREFVTFNTEMGDGVYPTSQGNSLGVDAGLIGCIRVCDIADPSVMRAGTSELNKAGMVIEFKEDFPCYSDGKTLVFGHIQVYTGALEDSDTDYYSDISNEDDDEEVD